ncbi:unnamed protein product [Caenorhabditis angaria]|uniref:Uncharacterized protein n=1 Tax=Caenorhabditis angaria TaxID=860376 RepID=A0A9P1IQH5_9PELO|nr:unnamed protein product [Caenorhabditis angaria]
MHIFCLNCKSQCIEPDARNVSKCLVCQKVSAKFMKLDQNMPPDIKAYFDPITNGYKKMRERCTQILTFQRNQRSNYTKGLRKKEEFYIALQTQFNEERKKKETYKQALISCQQKLKEKTIELESFSSTRTLPESPLFTTRRNSDLYRTPCAANSNSDPFSTPKQPAYERTKSSLNSTSSASFIDEMIGAARTGRIIRKK